MVSFVHLVVSLSVIAGSLAAPKAETTPYKRDLEKRAPDFALGSPNPLSRRQNYNQDYQTGGDVVYTHTSNGFTVKFDAADDFVVGVGWNPGSAQDITFSGDFEPGTGTILLSVYGWTTNPLVEYYIVEDQVSFSGGTYKGSVTSDGATYNIYEDTRVNEPSIEGTSTFNQYISVRQSGRSSGTVTTANHFNAWKNLGMDLGTFNYQIIAAEGFNSATGAITQTVS